VKMKYRGKREWSLVTLLCLLLVFGGCGNDFSQNNPFFGLGTVDGQKGVQGQTSELVNITETAPGKYSCAYEGIGHDFLLNLPDEVDQAPLVFVLHGYGESAEGMRRDCGFEIEANAAGYAVVYVDGAPEPGDGTSAKGWNSGLDDSKKDDVGFLCALAEYLCEAYHLNSERVFAVGFSNGAFMAQRLAMEAQDHFAAVVSVAGMLPQKVWLNRTEECSVGVFQVTGEKDDLIPKEYDGSDVHADAPAIEKVLEYYIEKNGLELQEIQSVGRKSSLMKYASPDSQKQVWSLFIPDGRHSWPEEKITGIRMNELILEFLETQ